MEDHRCPACGCTAMIYTSPMACARCGATVGKGVDTGTVDQLVAKYGQEWVDRHRTWIRALEEGRMKMTPRQNP